MARLIYPLTESVLEKADLDAAKKVINLKRNNFYINKFTLLDKNFKVALQKRVYEENILFIDFINSYSMRIHWWRYLWNVYLLIKS